MRLRSRTVGRRRLIDPDDLLDIGQVAERIGLSSPDAAYVYISRYDDFPEPWINRGRYIRLWLPQDVDAWLRKHPGVGRRRSQGDSGDEPEGGH